jgi:hypothetical protein
MCLPFDEQTGSVARDVYGNHDATLMNLPIWLSTGRFNGGITISNSKAYLTVSDPKHDLDDLYNGGMSVAVWIKPTTMGASSLGRIVDKQGSSTTTGWIIRTENLNTFSFGAAFGTTSLLVTAVANSLKLNDWNHVTVTWDGGMLISGVKLYVNGALVGINTLVSTNGAGVRTTDAGITLCIGNRASDLARGMAGALDDFRIYDRVISKSEVSGLQLTPEIYTTALPSSPVPTPAVSMSASPTRVVAVPSSPSPAPTHTSSPTPPVNSKAKKWNPGHYAGANTTLFTGSMTDGRINTINSEIDMIKAYPLVKGYLTFISWGAIEGNQDDYSAGFALIDSMLARLGAMSPQRRLAIKIQVGGYTRTHPGNGDYSIIPKYLQSNVSLYGQAGYRVNKVITTVSGVSGWFGGDGNGNTHAAQMHNPNVMNRFVKMLQALAARYDKHPLVEAFVWEESSFVIGANDNNKNPSWNNNQLIVNYQNALKAHVAACPMTNVVFENTYNAPTNTDNNETSTQKFMDFMYANKVIPGATDTGGFNYIKTKTNGIPLSWGMAAYVGHKTANSSWTPRDYRSLTRSIVEVQGPDLGAYLNEPFRALTPQDMLDSLNTYSHASHVFWSVLPDAIKAAGTGPIIHWSTLGPFLNDPKNALMHTQYPQNY